jgi:hypothetical protein
LEHGLQPFAPLPLGAGPFGPFKVNDLPPVRSDGLDEGLALKHAPFSVVSPHTGKDVTAADPPVQRDHRNLGPVGGFNRGHERIFIARAENKRSAPEADQSFDLVDLFAIVILAVADIELESELFGFLFQPAFLSLEEGKGWLKVGKTAPIRPAVFLLSPVGFLILSVSEPQPASHAAMIDSRATEPKGKQGVRVRANGITYG